MRSRALLGLLAGAFVFQLCVGAGVASAAMISTTPPCGGTYNPYDYTSSALGACGLKAFPETSITSLSGGGSSYDYDEGNGVVAHLYVPPASFDPTTASPAQLAEYGFPPRPTDLTQLAAYDQNFRKFTVVAPPPFLVELPNVTADIQYTPNWSGFVITGSAGKFTYTDTAYYEPSFGGSRCTSNAEVSWSGIGGWGLSDPLGQEGTAHNVPNLADHQAWDEVYPLENIIPLNLVASAGQYMVDSTAWYTGPTRYAGFVQDVTTSQIIPWSLDVSSSYFTGDAADAVAERPTIGGSYANLSNFGTMYFYGASAQGKTFDQYSSTGGRHGVYMTSNGYSNGTLLAQPSGIGSGGNFSDTQKSCN